MRGLSAFGASSFVGLLVLLCLAVGHGLYLVLVAPALPDLTAVPWLWWLGLAAPVAVAVFVGGWRAPTVGATFAAACASLLAVVGYEAVVTVFEVRPFLKADASGSFWSLRTLLGAAVVLALTWSGRIARIQIGRFDNPASQRRAMIVLFLLALLAVSTVPSVSLDYFPRGTWGPDAAADRFRRSWYAEHLHALGEPSLFESSRASDVEIYRFLWLRTFDPPVAVRVTLAPDSAVEVRSTDGAGGYEPGVLVFEESRSLAPEEVEAVRKAIAGMDFWALPTEERDVIGIDGARWVVEGVRSGRYHLVDRLSPDEGPVRDFGLLMLGLSGADLEPIY